MYPPMIDLDYALERQKTLLGEPTRELPVLRYGRRPDIWRVFRATASRLWAELVDWGRVPCAEMEPVCEMQFTR